MKQWKLKDIVLMSVLGVVFGLIYLAFFGVGNLLYGVLTPFGLGPLSYELIFGIWFIVSIIAAYIIRKPGVAFTSETIAALTEVLVGSTAGPALILSGMVQGLGAELGFAVTRWKDYRLRVLILAGMLAATVSFPYAYFMSGYDAYAGWLVIAMFITRLISGALITGLLGKYIADQLAATGALSGYPLGRERQKRHEQSNVS